ncbi:MAG TPA: glycoside hydrolase family 125 protein, partial [Candidatus Baltobacteraceae bacterium]|nr:glycoside hydrolase family 125 protein [Candidatus Baltobacteraceae bacterium]
MPITVAPETLFHTLATDFFVQPDGTIYVQTGDIPAMWLRDSAAQMLPYVRLGRSRPALRTWIRAVIAREARNVAIDPYANAFTAGYGIWERKWEVDSLAYPVLLAWAYEHEEDDRRVFTPVFHGALELIVRTYACERRHSACSHYRLTAAGPPIDRGSVAPIGMIWSAFRASDDPTRYAYNIPEQMQAAAALRDIAELAERGYADHALAARAAEMAGALDLAIARFGTFHDARCGGTIYAYEIDGLGHRIFLDDANLPSLLAAPVFGSVSVDDPIYRRTRACVLSQQNPYYYEGHNAQGVGSPHTPRGYVWPLAIIARALTSVDRAEVLDQLRMLSISAGRDGLIHESFNPNDPRRFTRAQFGW